MNRPSKKSIREAIEQLKKPAEKSSGGDATGAPALTPKKAKTQIRKKGV